MDFESSVLRRQQLAAFYNQNSDGCQPEVNKCRGDVVHWVNSWCWTYDPREPDPIRPFDLFPRQEEFLRWLTERDARQESGLAEKSRDVGFTWLCTAYALHCWLFKLADSTGFGSRKLDLVDHRDNPDCIFEKCRFLYRHLPGWMLPKGFVPGKHDKYCTLLNPENGSTITGEGGSEIGRGGRKSRYFVDEAAYLPNPKSVEAALSQTTRVRIDVSTPNGMGNPFHTRRFNGSVPVFTFHWRDDPRKNDAWYEREKQRIADPVIIAQELDIDYSASIENVCIPAMWVNAAVGLPLKPGGFPIGGWDVADTGRCKNVLVCRHGPVVVAVRHWGEMDLLQSTHHVIEVCQELGIVTLYYDSIGVGAAVRANFNALTADNRIALRPVAVNVGDAPRDRIWPDGKSSRERFRNLRSEMWWMLRTRFEKANNFAAAIAAGTEFTLFPQEEMISLPLVSELIQQIALPLYFYTETGKVQLESKQDLKKRGIDSPDFADALALAFSGNGEEMSLSLAVQSRRGDSHFLKSSQASRSW